MLKQCGVYKPLFKRSLQTAIRCHTWGCGGAQGRSGVAAFLLGQAQGRWQQRGSPCRCQVKRALTCSGDTSTGSSTLRSDTLPYRVAQALRRARSSRMTCSGCQAGDLRLLELCRVTSLPCTSTWMSSFATRAIPPAAGGHPRSPADPKLIWLGNGSPCGGGCLKPEAMSWNRSSNRLVATR